MTYEINSYGADVTVSVRIILWREGRGKDSSERGRDRERRGRVGRGWDYETNSSNTNGLFST